MTTGADGSACLELESARFLTQAQRQALTQANAQSAVTVVTASGLQVRIPAGTLADESQVDGLLADVAGAKEGDVVIRTDEQGRRHVVPLALVSDGKAVYVAAGPGQYRLERGSTSFADTEGHWARSSIAFSAARELTRGMSENTFDPERPATRAMVFTLLARLEGADLPDSQGAWYDSAVTWAMGRGLTDGDRPVEDVKRQELATLLWRWAGQPEATGELTGFTDLWAVAPYARVPLSWAVETGILTGRMDASLDPTGPATRAETAVMLERFITYLVKEQVGT